jgi:hypothetical protein
MWKHGSTYPLGAQDIFPKKLKLIKKYRHFTYSSTCTTSKKIVNTNCTINAISNKNNIRTES